MASTTRMPQLDPVDSLSAAAPAPSGPRRFVGRLFSLGLGDLRALGRSLRAVLQLVARRFSRAVHLQELEAAREELGRLAADLPLAAALPARTAVLEQRAARDAASAEAEEARARLRTAEAEFTSREGEFKSVLCYLDSEENEKRRALNASEASTDPAVRAAIDGLRRGLDELQGARADKQARWRQQETALRAAQVSETAALEKACAAVKTATAALGPAHRALGREVRTAGLQAPETGDALARVIALDGDCRQDESALGLIGANLCADRFRMLRALAVVLGLLVLVLLVWPQSSQTRASRGRRDAASAESAGAVPAAMPEKIGGEALPTAAGDFPSESLQEDLLALPALAGPSVRPTGRFELLERRPVAGGLERLLIAVEVSGDGASGRHSIQLSVLVDHEDRIVETGPARPVGPEDDELFRLLEERS